MMKARIVLLAWLALGAPSLALAQQDIQLKFSRVVDLTIPIESNMPGIPGIKTYADNPSKVDVVTVITEAQKGQLQTEGMTLNSNLAVNGRSMISILSILVHNGTHIDAPRHMMEKGTPIDQMPLGQLAKEGVLINLPTKGPNSVVTVKDIEDSRVELGPNRIPVIHTGFTEKTGVNPSSGRRCPIWEPEWGH
jgi:kynurenine formamidase